MFLYFSFRIPFWLNGFILVDSGLMVIVDTSLFIGFSCFAIMSGDGNVLMGDLAIVRPLGRRLLLLCISDPSG